jgi:hypothetical protein
MLDTAGLGGSRLQPIPFQRRRRNKRSLRNPKLRKAPVRASRILATTTTRDNYNALVTIESDTSTLLAQTQATVGHATFSPAIVWQIVRARLRSALIVTHG